MAYSVSQRAKEIGVRMALGAQNRDVMNLILRRGLRLTLTGLVLGVVASLALGSSVRSLLYGVQAGDPVTLLGAAVVLATVALLASYVPARRATLANPGRFCIGRRNEAGRGGEWVENGPAYDLPAA